MSAFDLFYAHIIVLAVTDAAGVLALELCPKPLALRCVILNTGRENSFFRDAEKMFLCIQ